MNEKGGEVGDAFKAASTASAYLLSSTILICVLHGESSH